MMASAATNLLEAELVMGMKLGVGCDKEAGQGRLNRDLQL